MSQRADRAKHVKRSSDADGGWRPTTFPWMYESRDTTTKRFVSCWDVLDSTPALPPPPPAASCSTSAHTRRSRSAPPRSTAAPSSTAPSSSSAVWARSSCSCCRHAHPNSTARIESAQRTHTEEFYLRLTSPKGCIGCRCRGIGRRGRDECVPRSTSRREDIEQSAPASGRPQGRTQSRDSNAARCRRIWPRPTRFSPGEGTQPSRL